MTAILSLSLLFFLIHRLRQRKIQGIIFILYKINIKHICSTLDIKINISIYMLRFKYIVFGIPVCVAGRENRQLGEDERSLSSMGYMERNSLPHGVPMDDMPCGAGYSLWKPHGNYFPRGEAPPPYEEAVAAARAEQALLSMNPLLSMNFSDNYLPNINNHTSIAVMQNTQSELIVNTQPSPNDNGINASLISSSSRPLSSPSAYGNYRSVGQSNITSTDLNTNSSTTSFTMGTNTYENLPAPVGLTGFNNQPNTATSIAQSLPMSHSTIPKSYRQHSTFPRQSGAFTISATLSNSDVSSHRTIPRALTTRVTNKPQDVFTNRPTMDYLCLSSNGITPQSLSHSMQLPPANQHNYKNITNPDTFYTDASTGSASGVIQSERYAINGDVSANVSEKTYEFKVR